MKAIVKLNQCFDWKLNFAQPNSAWFTTRVLTARILLSDWNFSSHNFYAASSNLLSNVEANQRERDEDVFGNVPTVFMLLPSFQNEQTIHTKVLRSPKESLAKVESRMNFNWPASPKSTGKHSKRSIGRCTERIYLFPKGEPLFISRDCSIRRMSRRGKQIDKDKKYLSK